jgi:hypothetical protein
MNRRPRSTGQALVEFALIIPIFLVLLMGIFDFGRVVWAQNSLASAAREGARFAIVHGGSSSDSCPVGPLSPDYGGTVAGSCVNPSPSKQAVKDAALSAALAGGIGVAVTVCYGVGCVGDTDNSILTDGNNARGHPVTVVISSQIPLTVPALLGFSTFSVSGSSTMLVNH